MPESRTSNTDSFIARWRGVAVLPGSTELATAQSFVTELCALLGVASPHHAEDYQFEPKPTPAKRLVVDTIMFAARPLDLDQLADHFTGRGAWRKRLPDIVDSLTAIGRVKTERSGARLVVHA